MPELPVVVPQDPPEKKRPTSGKVIREHVQRNKAGYAKLVGAITALTTAIAGYTELARNNQIVYQTLATKVNSMAEELSWLKGQNELMLIFLQAKLGGEIVPPTTTRDEATPAPRSPPPEERGSARGAIRKAPPVRSERLPEKPPKELQKELQKEIVVDAFKKLPPNLEALMAEQKALK